MLESTIDRIIQIFTAIVLATCLSVQIYNNQALNRLKAALAGRFIHHNGTRFIAGACMR